MFTNGSDPKHRELLHKTLDLSLDFLSGKGRNNKVINFEPTSFFKNKLTTKLPQKGITDEDLLDTLKEIGYYSVAQSDINYLAFPDSGNSVAGLMGEIYTKFINQNMISFDKGAPMATFIEIQLLEWIRELIGYESIPVSEYTSRAQVAGMCTSGGHMSNHIAVLTALNNKFPEVKDKGLGNLGVTPKVVLAKNIGHSSEMAAIHHLGLGKDNVISAKTTEEYTTDYEDLERILEENKSKNEIFMVFGVAGNCRTSSIDEVDKLAEICARYKVWLHVDACHGGSLLFSDKIKNQALKGVEKADSIAIDPHKGMFLTYPLSFVLFKERNSLLKFTNYEDQMLAGHSWDIGICTPFYGSRGFESLKLWLMLKHIGKEKLGQIVEERAQKAKFASEIISKSNIFTPLHELTFYRYSYVFLPKEIRDKLKKLDLDKSKKEKIKNCIDFYTNKINQELYEEGNVCFDEFKLEDISNRTALDITNDSFYVICQTIGNPLQTEETITKSLDFLLEKGRQYIQYFHEDIELILTENVSKDLVVKSYGPASWY